MSPPRAPETLSLHVARNFLILTGAAVAVQAQALTSGLSDSRHSFRVAQSIVLLALAAALQLVALVYTWCTDIVGHAPVTTLPLAVGVSTIVLTSQVVTAGLMFGLEI